MKKRIASLIILLLVLAVIGQAKTTKPNPRFQDIEDGVSIKALQINKEIREFYKQSLVGTTNFKVEDINRFNNILQRLESLQAEINDIGGGETGDEIVRNAKIFRAIAWIHGWATFSQLTFKSSQLKATPELREKLISLGDSPSSLQLLIKIHEQISASENNVVNPLRTVLKDDPGFIVYLGYREKWLPGEDKSGITHAYYIPSSIDLLGSANDSIKVDTGRRHILSLWALANLQLDTWHSIPVDPTMGIYPGSSKYAENYNFQNLIEWLRKLKNFGYGYIGNDIQNSKFRTKIGKIANFLSWRQTYSDESNLATFIDNIDTRNTNGKLAESLGELLDAAKPTDNEYLYPAAFWVRYVYLLSIDNPRRALSTEEQVQGFLGIWKGLELGDLITDRKNEAKKNGFLRWNSMPPNGDCSALVSDLTNVSWKLLEFERKVKALEKNRFETIAKSSFVGQNTLQQANDLASYTFQLEKLLSELRIAYGKYISVYYDSGENIAKFSGKRAYFQIGSTKPSEITGKFVEVKETGGKTSTKFIGGKLDENFRTSAIETEQDRLLDDLTATNAEIKNDISVFGFIKEVYSGKDPKQIASSLQNISEINPFLEKSIYQLPTKSISAYKESLDESIKQLKNELNIDRAKKDLVASYKSKKDRLAAARLRYAAAKIGEKMAKKAVEISETFQKIADLEAEIGDLESEIAKLEKDGWDSSLEASNRKLADVERLRDLAAARVDALGTAIEQASTILVEQEKDLGQLANDFKKAADEGKARKESKGFFNALRTIVSVVGVALSPFFGPASIGVAQMINTGISTYEQLRNVNWNNKGEAIQAIGNVANSLGQAIDTGVSTFGGAEAKQKLAQIKDFIATAKSDINQVSGEVQNILKYIGNLEKNAASNIASALANGYTIKVGDNGKINIILGEKKVVFSDPGFKNSLKEFISNGGTFLNDLKARNGDLLPELGKIGDDKLRQKLKEVVIEITKQLPPELFNKWKALGVDAKKEAEKKYLESLNKLKEKIDDPSTLTSDLRLMAQSLSGGWLIVTDDGAGIDVSAVQPPFDKEALQFKLRLESLKNNIINGTLKKLTDSFIARRDKILKRAEDINKTDDPQDLEKLANELPATLNETKVEINGIQEELIKAEGELTEAKGKVEIAYYETEAIKKFREASEKRLIKADKNVQMLVLEKRRALLMFEKDTWGLEQSNLVVQAALAELNAAEVDFQRTYETCLNFGFDPLFKDPNDIDLSPLPSSRIRTFWMGYENDNSFLRVSLARIASDFIGLLQWYSMVSNPNDKETDEEPSSATIFASLAKQLSFESPENIRNSFEKIEPIIIKAYKKKAEKRLSVFAGEDKTDKLAKIKWVGEMSERQKLIFWESRRIPTEMRPYIIGYINFRFEADSGHDPLNLMYYSAGPDNDSHYADLNETYVACENCANLRFIPVPPFSTKENISSLRVGNYSLELNNNDSQQFSVGSYKIDSDEKGEITTSSILGNREFETIGDALRITSTLELLPVLNNLKTKTGTFENLTLTGVYGSNKSDNWVFYIIDPTNPKQKTPAQIQNQINELSKTPFHFVIGVIQIDTRKKY